MGDFLWGLLSVQDQVQRIMNMNAKTEGFGVVLSKEDAELLLEKRKEVLMEQQRVEFSESILPKLIFTFCDSPYIEEENYVQTLTRLQEIFYLYKNETMDEVTDDELLDFMKEAFDGVCHGSLEYLEGTKLEEFARNIRRERKKTLGQHCGIRNGELRVDGYQPEELSEVVAWLSQMYTSKESTSVSYDRARQLMEAVIYCISLCEVCTLPAGVQRLSAKEAYQAGYELLICKVKKVKNAYNRMIMQFCAYGNENYEDTVVKGIPGFFRYYDPRFAPQETILTMDYPVLTHITDVSGILAIEKYVNAVCMEQEFLGKMPDAYVCRILERFHRGYRKQFFNIAGILLRHVLGCMLAGKKLGTSGEPSVQESGHEYERLYQFVRRSSREEIRKKLSDLLSGLIRNQYGGNAELLAYLQNDLEDFTAQLILGATYDHLEKIVIL